jgi:predicted ATPase
MQITSIKIERFKGIQSLEFDLKDITLLIGGNNAGKSSILQGAHFAITTLQTSLSNNSAITLGIDQLIYKPANDLMLLNHLTSMTQTSGPLFEFSLKGESDEEIVPFALQMYRGKNANLSINYNRNHPFFDRAADRTRPFSIFVPGLAGVALREERRSEAILTTGIAQGDSNLYLRNVLLRIIHDSKKLERFHETIGTVFPELEISTDFDEYRHLYIPIYCRINGITVPLEMVGTGCLQAIQLVAYATMYDPALLLLDEPDSHLHPSNQRLLAGTLINVSQKLGIKIILSTHSRHILDALSRYDQCGVIWLQNGKKKEYSDRSDLSLLLDLGALDSFELIGSGKIQAVVLTEDTKTQRLQFLLESNGFKKGCYLVQSYHGVDQIRAAFSVADFFTKLGSNTCVLIHRDGDAILAPEKKWLIDKAIKNNDLPERATLFITDLTDIEHTFCQSRHVAAVYNLTQSEADLILKGVMDRLNGKLIVEFTNKRRENKEKLLRKFEGAPSAVDLVDEKIDFSLAKGKTLFGPLLKALSDAGYNNARLTTTTSPAIEIPTLRSFAESVWPSSENQKPYKK